MPSVLKWEGSSSATELLTTELNSLADNTITSASSEYDNETNLDTFAWFELNVNFGSSPTDDAPSVDIYMIQAPDGTNYDSDAVTGGANQGHLFLVSIPVRAVSTAQRLIVGPVSIPPHKFKVLADNQTGVAFPASGSTLDIYVNNLESQ